MCDKTWFSEAMAENDPFVHFDKWYKEHLSLSISVPDSFSLATASSGGKASVRTVLLKSYGREGFVFFTNYESKKGKQLEENPYAAMLFYWPESSRQIRIEGSVVRLPEGDSVKYFLSRPKESQIGAWASRQSTVIPDRDYLENRFTEFQDKFHGKNVPKPPYWGGYRIIPSWFEFWQEGKHRLHDRLIYVHENGSWKISRLSP
jgi:pyridoxamine 5'-phosphate oxidase